MDLINFLKLISISPAKKPSAKLQDYDRELQESLERPPMKNFNDNGPNLIKKNQKYQWPMNIKYGSKKSSTKKNRMVNCCMSCI